MHESPRISIVIPTYKENAYLGRTLENLRHQTVIDEAEIILADYNPDASTWYKTYLGPNVRYVQVDRKGIAYGRHKGIEASKGEVIVNFDADARYDTIHALDFMTQPITEGRCVLTCCDNIFDLRELRGKELEAMRIPIATANMLCAMQRTAHLACLEPGSAFSRQAYNVVGGYNDVMQHELWLLSHRIMLKYLPFNVQHVPTAAVYVSARRAKKFVDLGIGVLDYSNKAFR